MRDSSMWAEGKEGGVSFKTSSLAVAHVGLCRGRYEVAGIAYTAQAAAVNITNLIIRSYRVL